VDWCLHAIDRYGNGLHEPKTRKGGIIILLHPRWNKNVAQMNFFKGN
jgi:hypothetical protein